MALGEMVGWDRSRRFLVPQCLKKEIQLWQIEPLLLLGI